VFPSFLSYALTVSGIYLMVVEVNIKIGLTKGLGRSVARAGCKMRQCGSTGADDKPQRALQDENCFILSRSVGTGVNWAPSLEGEKDFPIQIPW